MSIYDLLPFEYKPVKIKAVSNYINNVCKTDKPNIELKVKDEKGRSDDLTKEMIDTGFLEIKGVLVTIRKMTRNYRGFSFYVYQQARYSDYMSMDMWSTIEVRIIC